MLAYKLTLEKGSVLLLFRFLVPKTVSVIIKFQHLLYTYYLYDLVVHMDL